MTRDEALAWGQNDRERRPTSEIPAPVRDLVTERQGGRHCVLCRIAGFVPPADEPLELDHLQPLSQGGTNHHLNLRWLCRSHNRGRRAGEAPRVPKWKRRRR